jgi:hypothetical protein
VWEGYCCCCCCWAIDWAGRKGALCIRHFEKEEMRIESTNVSHAYGEKEVGRFGSFCFVLFCFIFVQKEARYMDEKTRSICSQFVSKLS